MTLQDTIHKVGLSLKKYAPEILTTISVAGLGVTTYLGSRAGYKAGMFVMADVAERIDSTPDGEDTVFMDPKEIIKETWKFYIPVVIVGVATAGAIIGSHKVSHNRQLALISAAAISEKALREYQAKVIETTSKPKERKIQDEIAQDRVNEKRDELNNLVLVNDGDVLCIEMYTGRTFVSTAEKIHRAENDINRQVNHDGYASHNEFMSLLGLSYVEAGEAVGWNNDNILEVVIGGAVHDESKPVLTVGYTRLPKAGYSSPW